MTTDTTASGGAHDTTGVTSSSSTGEGVDDDYRKAVRTLRVVKLALGVLVSALTVLRLVGVI